MEPTKTYRVVLITLCSSILYFSFGTILGWTSPIIPKLRDQSPDSPLNTSIEKSDEGWIGSLVSIGGLSASLFAGPLAGRIGRKQTLLLSAIFFAASYILFMFGIHVWIICFARFIQGMGGGLTSNALPVYIGEIAPDEYRGALGSLYNLFLIVGILYVFTIGPYVSYIALQWYCLAIPVVFFAIFCFMPESPYFLAAKGRKMDGIKALKFIRGQSTQTVKIEMNKIQKTVDESMSQTGTIFDIFCNRGYRKSLLICCGLLNLQALSGTSAITFNCQTIFMSAGSTVDPALASILLALVQLVGSLLTPLFVERTGRKILLLMSASGMSLALFTLGTFFYIRTFYDASNIIWIPIPALIFFYFMFSFGFGPIPWAVLGEIFPSNIKAIASSIATSNIWVMTFLVTRCYPELDALGSYYAFWLFGCLCILAIFFVLFVMVETKGLSLQEIQELLQGSEKSHKNGQTYEVVQTKLTVKV